MIPTGFYADVADSTWLGGNASEDGGLHERLPYWMNGAVTLAFLLPEDGPVVQAEAPICPARIGSLTSHALGFGREAVQPPQICAVRSSNDSFSLRGEVSRIIYAILDAQTPDGWYGGPANNDPTGADQLKEKVVLAELVPPVCRCAEGTLVNAPAASWAAAAGGRAAMARVNDSPLGLLSHFKVLDASVTKPAAFAARLAQRQTSR
jgi:hypothetical protein